MTHIIGRNWNRNSEAVIQDAIAVGSAVSVKILDAEVDPELPERIYVGISVQDKAGWLKLQPAATDNDQKGIYVPRNGLYELPADNMYSGEISFQAETGTSNVFVTYY